MDKMLSTVCALLAVVVACTPGKRPFQIVQLCLSDEQNLADFKGELQVIAQSEGMQFLDRSEQTKRELQLLAAKGNVETVTEPVINVTVIRKDGLGVGGGNLGLPGYQVAIGFSEGASPTEARRFAQMVIQKLEKQWTVRMVPPGTGAKPLADCSEQKVTDSES